MLPEPNGIDQYVTPALLFLLTLILFIGISLFAFNNSVMLSSVTVDDKTQEDCRLCERQFNLSLSNPVEGYYWLTMNEQEDPEMIIMKWEMHNACAWNCTIPDARKSAQMVLRVTE